MTRHPVLRPGDTLRLGGQTHTVAGLDSAMVRLADITGAVAEVPTAGLLADPSLELVTASRVRMAPQPALERLPAETVETARWWERHLIEVITGVPPDSPPGTRPRPEYDPARQSLRQRELAKHAELTRAGHRVGRSTLKRLRARYERDGLWGVIDHRAARRTAPAGYVDPRVVEATRQAIAGETDRSTGTVGGCAAGWRRSWPKPARPGTGRRCRPSGPSTGWRDAWPRAGTPSARRAPAAHWPRSLTGRSAR